MLYSDTDKMDGAELSGLHTSTFNQDVRQIMLVKEEAPEEHGADVDQQNPKHLYIKEEQEELWTSLEGEQFQFKEETDVARFPFTVVSVKIEADEEKPLFSQLHQLLTEDRDVPTSSPADQMIAETGGRAETSRNPDLNPHKRTTDSEFEVRGDDEEEDDVNLDSELSDSETGDEDGDWSESSSSESDESLQKHVRETSHSAIRSSGCLVNTNCDRVKKHTDPCKNVQTDLKSFTCNDCGKKCSTKSNLNRHMLVHTGQKPFACDLCGQIFSRKTSLNRHMSVHTGQKPFACDLCGQRFSQITSLNRHMSVHTEQKPFACDLCGKRFSQNQKLNSHMSVHTGQKPFPCEHCGKRYNLKTSLNRHMNVHTEQKPFACDLCRQRVSQMIHLNTRVHNRKRGPFFKDSFPTALLRRGVTISKSHTMILSQNEPHNTMFIAILWEGSRYCGYTHNNKTQHKILWYPSCCVNRCSLTPCFSLLCGLHALPLAN